MRVLLLLGMTLCVVQASLEINVIQNVDLGGCGKGPCDNSNGTKLTESKLELVALQKEAKVLEENLNKAKATAGAVDTAGDVIAKIKAALGITGRRHRRAAATVSYISCDDPTTNITGTTDVITLLAIDGITRELKDVITNGATKLNCFIAIAEHLTQGFKSGAIAKPANISAIENKVKAATDAATKAKVEVGKEVTKLATALEDKKKAIDTKKTEIKASGGSVGMSFYVVSFFGQMYSQVFQIPDKQKKVSSVMEAGNDYISRVLHRTSEAEHHNYLLKKFVYWTYILHWNSFSQK